MILVRHAQERGRADYGSRSPAPRGPKSSCSIWAEAPDLLVRAPLLAQALELGLDELCPTLRADAVGELRLGVLLDVALDLLPVVPVVAHLLAVGTDRQEPLEELHAGERVLKLLHPVGED